MNARHAYSVVSDSFPSKSAFADRAQRERSCKNISPYMPDYIIGDTILVVLTVASLFPLLARIKRLQTTFGLSGGYMLCNYMSATSQIVMMVVWWIHFQPSPRTFECISNGSLAGWEAYAALSRGLGIVGWWIGATMMWYVYLKYPRKSPLQRCPSLPRTEVPRQLEDHINSSNAQLIVKSVLPSIQTERSHLLPDESLTSSSFPPPQSGSAGSEQQQPRRADRRKQRLGGAAVCWTVLCIATIILIGLTRDNVAGTVEESLAAWIIGYSTPFLIFVGSILQFLTINSRTSDKDCSVFSPRTIFLQLLAHSWMAIRLVEEFDSQLDSALKVIRYYLWDNKVDWLGNLILAAGWQYYNLMPYIINMWCGVCMVILILRHLWVKMTKEGHQGRYFLVRYDRSQRDSS